MPKTELKGVHDVGRTFFTRSIDAMRIVYFRVRHAYRDVIKRWQRGEYRAIRIYALIAIPTTIMLRTVFSQRIITPRSFDPWLAS